LLREGNPEEAARVLSHWLRDHPVDTRAQDLLAAAYFEMGAYEDSLKLLEGVVKTWPHKARCWRNYAMVLRKVGRLDAALHAALEAVERDSSYRKAQVELRKVRRLLRLPTCRICGYPVQFDEEYRCSSCGWRYHEDCWREEKGCINPRCHGEVDITVARERVRAPEVPAAQRKPGCLPWSLLGLGMVAASLVSLIQR